MADKTKKEVMEKFGTENEFSKDSQRILHSCTKCDKKFPRLQSLKRHNTDETERFIILMRNPLAAQSVTNLS